MRSPCPHPPISAHCKCTGKPDTATYPKRTLPTSATTGRILLANLLQGSRSTFLASVSQAFLPSKKGMLNIPISVLGGWPTVSLRLLIVLTSAYQQRKYTWRNKFLRFLGEGAPFNGIRDRSRRELRVDSGVRGTQHASRRGTPWGVKPVDNGPTSASHTVDDRATPAT
jgi:hypothetical protein